MLVEFSHANLGEEIQTRAGYYVPLEEHILHYNGREVIYILGLGHIQASCCTAPGIWQYVQVPGFMVKKHIRGGDTSPFISQVEIITDNEDRNNISQRITEKYPGASIEMWT